MKTLFITAVLFLIQNIPAQPPSTLWSKTYGGSNIDVAHDVKQTADGGFIITGYTRSFGTMSGRNAWLVKTDSAGNEEWSNTFGGGEDEEGYSVLQSADGGYVFAGYTKSFGLGLNDVLLIKTDSSGNSQWIRTFGGAQDDEGYSLQKTVDGGYVIGGVTSSSGAGSRDMWLIKTDDTGVEEWNRTFGGFSSDGAWSVGRTSDGGYILTGWSLSNGPGFLGNAWLVKADSNGTEEWNRPFGGDDVDRGYSTMQTADGGYILTGYTSSFGAGLYDMLLIKTDSSGTEEWNKTFGGSGRDYGNSVQQTADGGYIVTGYTLSFGAGGDDLWVVKTDSDGNEEWSKTYGGGSSDVGYSVQQVSDGGYIIAGHTLSYGAGLHDAFVIRTAPEAAAVFSITPDSLFLGSAAAGDTLRDSLSVTNNGNAELIISSITSSNPLFSVSPASANIPADSMARFYVQFNAAATPGSQTGILQFSHNGATSPDFLVVRADVITGINAEAGEVPQSFKMEQNYPNPFNPNTTINFVLPKNSIVKLQVFDLAGRSLCTLADTRYLAGSYRVVWNGRDSDGQQVASGVYIYRIQAGSFVQSRKMLLIR
ncbi:MAG: T9SS type A sorting domain-containing protein [Calditrichia bacterium]